MIRHSKQLDWLTRPAFFVGSQAVVAFVLVSFLFARVEPNQTRPSLPEFSNRPLTIAPQYDLPQVITDEQLATVLHRLRPRLRHEQPKINHVDHALRFWGPEATFDDPKCLSGAEMQQILTDHQAFGAAWGDKTRPFLSISETGVVVRTQQDAATASHVDHTLATLAEIGTPLDHPVATASGPATVSDLLQHALRDFRLNQQEYEWTALAAALYAPTSRAWISREGERITFDRLAERLMRQHCVQGVCFGNHRLYTLTILLRVDDEKQIFENADTRQAIIDHLADMTRRLIASQSEAGYWDQNWYDGSAPVKKSQFDATARRLLATGHALEWWAMAPAELLPPREVLVRAGQWLTKEVEKMSEATIVDNYTFLTHVGRALCLWRNDYPSALNVRLVQN